jgi:hypothetical protein
VNNISVHGKGGTRINLYFLAFSVYGLLILPLRLHFRITLARESSYFIRVEAIGLPVPGLRRAGRKDPSREKPAPEKAHALSEINLKWLRCLTEKTIFRKVCRLGRLSAMHLHLRIAFGDAAATALGYSFSRTLLGVLEKTGALPDVFTANLQADFAHSEPALSLEGIITVRLGKLMGTFLSLGRAYLRRLRPKKEDRAKELPAG